MMVPNPLKEALAKGRLVVGHMVMEFTVPAIAQILRPLAPDFVLFDLEHTGLSLQTLAPLLGSCRLAGLVPVVRVPGLSGHYISRCLDLGALGIMMPNVQTAEEARAFVTAAKYPPDGRRGMGLGGAHTGYQMPDPSEYARWANEQVVLISQIESATGVANVDAILAVPGIDIGWVGHMDLSLSLGIVGQYEDERLIAALKRVAEACKRHGKGAGIQPGSLDVARRWYDLGYNVLSFATDIAVYQRALGEGLQALRQFALPTS
ncbi:MAG: HpcH/HpaI aldolase family protein [Anaerolineae bacterium]